MKTKSFFNCIRIAIVLIVVSCLSVTGIIPVCAETESGGDMSIRLQSVKFDPVVSIPTGESANLFRSSYPTGIDSYIIQFDGPVTDEYTGHACDLGVKFYGYVPNHAFIVRMDDATRQKVESLSFVRWVGLYQPAYRISPSVLEEMETDDITIVNVLLFDVDKDVVTSEIQALDGDIITSSHKGWLRVSIGSSKIPDIASIDGVVWIEKYAMPELYNNVSVQIMNVDPIVWDTYGLNGTGQIVAVADTGLDTGVNNATMHADVRGRISNISSWPIQPGWAPFVENPGADDGASDVDSGHGTHVSGSVLGNGTESNGDIKGIAYTASLFFQAIGQWVNMTPAMEVAGYPDGYYLAGLPDDLNDLFQQAYDGGARIHSNSWGSAVAGEYNLNANETDMFMWNHKDMTILFSAGNSGNDSDRDGVIDYDSIGSPGTAKNCITVGASENVRLAGGYQNTWGALWPNNYPINPIRDDNVSNNANGMAAFSSRGPCDDGRIKPDVVAPGTNILSTRSSVAAGVGWGVCNQYYVYMGGTSMSTPLTAGASALVRQYYMENRSHTPNASLIKATLINGAFDMPGQYVPDETGPTPNNNSGWGRVDLANSIFPTPPKVLLFNDSEFSLSTGQNQSFYYKVTNKTVPLNITMVWTDYPAIVPAGGIVNDLDIIVTSPCGDVYDGNDFIAPFDDTFDRTNNVEQVRIGSPAIGVYNVTVNAYTVPNGPQDFSIVLSGAAEQVEAPTEVEKAIEKGLCWLNETQNPDGSWSGDYGANVGYTSLAALAFLNYGIGESDPTVSKAINYILSNKDPDGSIYVSYSNYETSLAILPLVATHNSSYDDEIVAARDFLVDIQNDESEGLSNADWTYGGWGYGANSPAWSDLSNAQWSLMGLDAANLSKSSDTWSKGELYVTRCQNWQATNPYAVTNDGGFTYQPPNISQWWGCGGNTSLSYGAMSAAGVWSLVLCSVDTSDQRVQAGLGWLRDNYAPIDTVGNPCYGDTYLYYYLLGFAKTLIMTGIPIGSWQETASQDITNCTVNQQHDDGHWSSSEGDIFATEQAILALQTRIIPADIQRLSWLTFILHSPVDLHIYDPLERHVGMNYTTGEIEVQIPNATYNTSNGDINITVPHLEAGDYRLILIGTGTGNYTLDIIGRFRDTVVSEDSYTGNITEGEVHDATVTVAMITGLSIHITEAPAPTLETTLTEVSLASLDPTITKVCVSGLNLSDVNETYKPASVTSRSAYMVNSTGAGNFTLRFTGVPNANTITAYKINATNHWIALDATTTTDTVTFGMEAGDPPVVFGAPPITPPRGGGGGSGTYPPGWDATPTPTVTATSTPTAPPGKTPTQQEKTVTPAPTKPAPKEAPTGMREVSEEAPTKGKDTPGFTAIFAIAGMLAVAYLALRRRQG